MSYKRGNVDEDTRREGARGQMRPISGCCFYKTRNIKGGQQRESRDGFSSVASEGTQPNLLASRTVTRSAVPEPTRLTEHGKPRTETLLPPEPDISRAFDVSPASNQGLPEHI